MARTLNKKQKPSSKIIADIEAHADEIRKLGVESLDLFGSRARGDERADSDLDVLIEYKTGKPFTLYELVRLKRYLEGLTGLTVHVSTRKGFRPAHLQRVLKESVNVL